MILFSSEKAEAQVFKKAGDAIAMCHAAANEHGVSYCSYSRVFGQGYIVNAYGKFNELHGYVAGVA